MTGKNPQLVVAAGVVIGTAVLDLAALGVAAIGTTIVIAAGTETTGAETSKRLRTMTWIKIWTRIMTRSLRTKTGMTAATVTGMVGMTVIAVVVPGVGLVALVDVAPAPNAGRRRRTAGPSMRARWPLPIVRVKARTVRPSRTARRGMSVLCWRGEQRRTRGRLKGRMQASTHHEVDVYFKNVIQCPVI
jgi:hypothetical protein